MRLKTKSVKQVFLPDLPAVFLKRKDLQNKIDDGWNSDSVKDRFVGSVPGSVDEVCIGDIALGKNSDEYEILKIYEDRGANLFFYPPVGSCDIKYVTLEHARFSGFSCIDVKNGKATLALEKGAFDNAVLVKAES